MRISDWSSDVCSSDLPVPLGRRRLRFRLAAQRRDPGLLDRLFDRRGREFSHSLGFRLHDILGFQIQLVVRSEEHTSELQSLMRISYAVFCLKKKKHNKYSKHK